MSRTVLRNSFSGFLPLCLHLGTVWAYFFLPLDVCKPVFSAYVLNCLYVFVKAGNFEESVTSSHSFSSS